MESFDQYHLTAVCLALTGLMMLVQALVVDFAGMKAGHRAGHEVVADRDVFHFRAVRALANTNETIAIFILLALAGILAGAHPGWLNLSAAIYFVSRLVHMLAYYANQQPVRSIAFGISLVGLLSMFAACVAGLLD